MNQGKVLIDLEEDGKLIIKQEGLEPSEVLAVLGNSFVIACKEEGYIPKDITDLLDVVIKEKYKIKTKRRGKK